MVIILVAQPNGQMQFITEGVDQAQGVIILEQACKQIRAQALANGTPIPQGVGTNGGPVPPQGVPGVPPPPDPPKRNVRETIIFPPKQD